MGGSHGHDQPKGLLGRIRPTLRSSQGGDSKRRSSRSTLGSNRGKQAQISNSTGEEQGFQWRLRPTGRSTSQGGWKKGSCRTLQGSNHGKQTQTTTSTGDES